MLQPAPTDPLLASDHSFQWGCSPCSCSHLSIPLSTPFTSSGASSACSCCATAGQEEVSAGQLLPQCVQFLAAFYLLHLPRMGGRVIGRQPRVSASNAQGSSSQCGGRQPLVIHFAGMDSLLGRKGCLLCPHPSPMEGRAGGQHGNLAWMWAPGGAQQDEGALSTLPAL